MSDLDFKIVFKDFNKGLSPVSHLDNKTFIGESGQASEMKADVISLPGFITQSPGLTDLTNGTQAGEVDELINYILDDQVNCLDGSASFAISDSKIYKMDADTIYSGDYDEIDQQYLGSDFDFYWGRITSVVPSRVYDGVGISFTAKRPQDLASVKLKMSKVGNPTDSVVLKLWTDTGSSVPGSVIATSTNSISGSSISADQYDEYEFTFAAGTTLSYNTSYILAPGRGSNSDTNYYKIAGSNYNLTEGSEFTYTTGASWTELATYNLYYKVYTTNTWPKTVNYGNSIGRLGDNLYIFTANESGGNIAKMHKDCYGNAVTSTPIQSDWGSTNDTHLMNAPHPVATKEDVMLFGNGRYVGVYIDGDTLDTQKLDFGSGKEVADIVFSANMWWIAVNTVEGKRGQIYLYDGSAISNILSDETGIGDQKIGFLYVHNGNVYVVYSDLTSDGYTVGVVMGRSVQPLRYFSGSLPTYAQKSLYKNTVIFVSDGSVYSCGASVEQLPIQLSELADAGYSTVGALAAPFGTPLVASTDGSTNYRIAKFDGYSTDSNYKTLFTDTSKDRYIGKVNQMIVQTKELGSSARCDVTIEGNQGTVTSSAFEVSGDGETFHFFRSIDLNSVEDIRVVVDYTNGDATDPCPIRKITLLGTFVEI